VTAAFEVDNETSFTNINSSDATFETSPNQTISFNTNATGLRIRLRFNGVASSNALSMMIRGFRLLASWRPTRKKQWLVGAKIEDNTRGLMGQTEQLRAQELLSRLDTLRKATAPIKLVDIDGVETDVNITNYRETQLEEALSEAGQSGARYARIVQLELTEN